MPDPVPPAATVTVAFSVHYPETVALAEPHMRASDLIVLEEPRVPGFEDMLAGTLPIDDYLLATDFEFPVFARMTCELLRSLHAEGRAVLQVEPYLEALYAVQVRLAEGGRPEDIPEGTLERAVYRTERVWSGALLGYYRASMGGTFEQAVDAVKLFGRADAARGRLRDDLRAQAVARLIEDSRTGPGPAPRRIYLEAGYVHVALLGQLRRRLPAGAAVEPLYLLEPVVRELTGRRQHLGPGDILTLTYVYRPDYEGERADLQAARSMVRTKILGKDEATEDLASFPQTRDEVEASRLVRSLSFAECKLLFGRIRRQPTDQAKAEVAAFVAAKERAGG